MTLALIIAFINRLPALVVGPAVAVVVLFGAVKWNEYVHDPMVRSAALAGYVKEVELVAAEGRAMEAKRQKAAGDAAASELATRLQIAQAARDEATQKLEQEIANHEKLGTGCPLSASDLDWLRK